MDTTLSENPIDDINPEKLKDVEHYEISKINNFIYLGSFEHPAVNSEEFQALGIDVSINCAAEIDYAVKLNCVTEKFPIIDGDSNTFLEHMDKAIETLVKYLSKGKKIYLHCHQGISRSPAILIYYLMVNKQFSYDKSLSLLRKKRSIIDIDPEFENALKVIDEN